MIENVEKFSAELRGEPFLELHLLGHRQIPIAETGVTPDVAAGCAESTDGRRDQHRMPLVVASKIVERIDRPQVDGVGGREASLRRSRVETARQIDRSGGSQLRARNRCRVAEIGGDISICIRAVRNGGIARFKVAGPADEIPAIGVFVGAAEIIGLIVAVPWLPRLDCYDGIEFPTLQQLSGRFLSRNCVGDGKRETVLDVKIAAGIFGRRIRAVLREELADIVGIIVQRVREGVRSEERQAVRSSLLQGWPAGRCNWSGKGWTKRESAPGTETSH